MSVPKRRRTKTRRNRSKRCLQAKRVTLKNFVKCPQCLSRMMPHRACPNCGFYKGREAVNTLKKVKKQK